MTTTVNKNIKAYTAMASLANIGINDVIEEPDKFQLNNQPTYYLTFLGTLLTAILIFIATIRSNTEMVITRLHNSFLDIKGYCKSIKTLSRNVIDSMKHCSKELPAKRFHTVNGNCNKRRKSKNMIDFNNLRKILGHVVRQVRDCPERHWIMRLYWNI
jgi:hypothetical protein